MDYSKLIPTTPPEGIVQYTLAHDKAMGVLAYKACMDTDVLTGIRIKAVEVTCTDCETTWIAERENVNSCMSGMPSFGFVNPSEGNGTVYHGQSSICPYCGAQVNVRHVSSISRYGSFLSAHHPISVHRVGDSIALVGWWIERTLCKGNGTGVASEETHIYPHEAYVLEGRKLVRLSAADKIFNRLRFNNEWSQRKRFKDMLGQCSCIFPPTYAAMEGTVAENCKLDMYMADASSAWPVEYLNMWAKHPNVENIVSSGGGLLLASMLASTATYEGYYYSHCHMDHRRLNINYKEVKPSRMLGLTTEEYRRAKAERWNGVMLDVYKRASAAGEYPTREEIKMIMNIAGSYGLKSLKEAGLPPLKTCKYLKKQKQSVTFFIDYRNMLAKHQEIFTQQELYPNNLRAAHDRLTLIQKLEEDAKTEAKFQETYEKYRELEWSDGEFDIIIPRHNSELYAEGKVLHHCVGGYGNNHVSGKPIFFVRRHRRPERNYFTLNIDMSTGREIQLHGYGNERRGSKSWNVPQAVRSFVDRWEAEVLAPWYRKNNRKLTKEKAA